MSKSSLLRIQKAIYDKLIADVTLMALITGIYDSVPADQLMPYIEIGEATETNFNTFDKQGREVLETIYIYSNYAGYLEGLTILDNIVRILDYQSISISDYTLVYIRQDDGGTLMEGFDQGRTRRITSRFRVIAQET